MHVRSDLTPTVFSTGWMTQVARDLRPTLLRVRKFKKKLVEIPDFMDYIGHWVFLECGEEIERLREAGIVPADKPPLGESLVMDSTDDEAWARPGRKSRKTGEDKPSKDPSQVGSPDRQECALCQAGSGKRGKGGSQKRRQQTTPNQAERKARTSSTSATRSTSSPTPTTDCHCSA